jgi:hypothetical protein
MSNPKLEGSNLIDCIPVGGKCKNDCKPCYYNDGGFYIDTTDNPLLPTLEDVGDKIVRVNSGGDSSLNFSQVKSKTTQYKKRFYNTSMPQRIQDFSAPVVFTCNPANYKWFYALSSAKNLMYVRIRTTTWNVDTVNAAINHYTSIDVPIVLTFLRFPLFYVNDLSEIYNMTHDCNYETKQSILNTYKIIKPDQWKKVMIRYKHIPSVLSCGNPESSYCKDCGNCEDLYYRAMALWYPTEVINE